MNSVLFLALFLASSVSAFTGITTEDIIKSLENGRVKRRWESNFGLMTFILIKCSFPTAETGETLARLILSRGVLEKLEEALLSGYEPRIPVFPNATEEPYELKDLAIHIPDTNPLKDLIYGNLSLW
jgi:hypothetical protein